MALLDRSKPHPLEPTIIDLVKEYGGTYRRHMLRSNDLNGGVTFIKPNPNKFYVVVLSGDTQYVEQGNYTESATEITLSEPLEEWEILEIREYAPNN